MRLRRSMAWVLFVLTSVACMVALSHRDVYATQDRSSAFAAATREHPAGTDALGRDRFVRVCCALTLSLVAATLSAGATILVAAVIGTTASLEPRWTGRVASLACDAFLALPWLFLLMIVRSAMPLNLSPIASGVLTFSLLAMLGWPAYAQAVQRAGSSIRGSGWMLHARASGLRGTQMLRYALPNLRTILLPQFFIAVPTFVIAEANLGALGLGIGEPLPSWGGMLSELSHAAMLVQTAWVYLPVGLLILVILLLQALPLEA